MVLICVAYYENGNLGFKMSYTYDNSDGNNQHHRNWNNDANYIWFASSQWL